MIAFLHTLRPNVAKFEALAKVYAPKQEIMHFVNEEILTNALASGVTDYAGFNAEVEKIKVHQPTLIICTCSSYGDACDRRTDIKRIDRPIVEQIVGNYNRIGLAYAALSTRDISANLITSTAKHMKKDVKIIDIDCSSAWPYYKNGRIDKYNAEIANTILKVANKVDVVFLAQASMEGSIDLLKEVDLEVLSSPAYGVEYYLTNEI